MTKTSPNRRKADLAMIHIAAKRLFGDVSKGSDGRADYEDWLETKTGKRSAGKLTTGERIDLIKSLRRDGLIADRQQGGRGQTRGGADRPTSRQWNMIGGLARDMGWIEGLEDARLAAFVKRTAKVDQPRFLSRVQATKVINGLQSWLAQQKGTSDAMP